MLLIKPFNCADYSDGYEGYYSYLNEVCVVTEEDYELINESIKKGLILGGEFGCSLEISLEDFINQSDIQNITDDEFKVLEKFNLVNKSKDCQWYQEIIEIMNYH